MALNPAGLESALAATFASLPASAGAAASALTAAYSSYASAGLFGSSLPTITDVQTGPMGTTLAGGMAVPGTPAAFAAAWAAAVTVFWVGVPVVGVQSGATVGCPGAAALTGSLTGVFANLANTAETTAAGMAAALHTATLTVTAGVAPPPGTVLPIT